MEDDRSFYERRMHEELARAMIEGTEDLRALHHRWAMLYKARLSGVPRGELRLSPADDKATAEGSSSRQ